MISRKAGTCLACTQGEVWYGPEGVEIRLCGDHARIVDGMTGWRRAGVQDTPWTTCGGGLSGCPGPSCDTARQILDTP